MGAPHRGRTRASSRLRVSRAGKYESRVITESPRGWCRISLKLVTTREFECGAPEEGGFEALTTL